MVATWDDSDEEISDDEEQQVMMNLALMAFEEMNLMRKVIFLHMMNYMMPLNNCMMSG